MMGGYEMSEWIRSVTGINGIVEAKFIQMRRTVSYLSYKENDTILIAAYNQTNICYEYSDDSNELYHFYK